MTKAPWRLNAGAQCQLQGPEFAARQVSVEFALHRRQGSVEGIGESLLRRLPQAEQRSQLPEIRFVCGVAAQHQVMGQQPRFRVEDPLLLALVVFRRLARDGE